MGAIGALTTVALAVAACAASPWPPEVVQEAEALVANIDFDSLINETFGHGGPWQGTVPPLSQYGMPPLNEQDSPQGVAGGFTNVTCFPSAMTVAMGWDRQLTGQFGWTMGLEQKGKGTTIMLGPAVNIARIPWGGRLWEYLGEDPYLAAQLAAPIVQGVQAHNISACVKHFALNVQEKWRTSVSANVDQRTAMELYFPAFESAVDAGVGSVMCSYNRINGTYACENKDLLVDLLRGQFGFLGFVRSDGFALTDTLGPALNGCDQEMPRVVHFGPALAAAVKAGNVTVAQVREKIMHIATSLIALNVVQKPWPTPADAQNNVTTFEHAQLARKLAAQGLVLLKNSKGLLPLVAPAGANANDNAGAGADASNSSEQSNKGNKKNKKKTTTASGAGGGGSTVAKSIAMFGDEVTVTCDGSGRVNPPYVVTPFQGIYARANGGWPQRPLNNCTFEPNTDFFQPDNECVTATSEGDCANTCTLRGSCVAFSYHNGEVCPGASSGSRCWLKPSTAGKRSAPGIVAGICPPMPAGARVNVTYGGYDPTAAAAWATTADVAIVVVATHAAEVLDRDSLDLPDEQNQLVAAVAAVNPNTIVVVRSPGPCLMPWLDKVSAVLFTSMQGQEAGNAIADVIFGDENPAGRLVHSFPTSMNDTWLSITPGGPINPHQYPGTDRGRGFPETDFLEGLLVGYRWFDALGRKPLFEFGFGLSYTSFNYSDLQVNMPEPRVLDITVSFTVTNIGSLAGAEVAQLYIGFPAIANEPPNQLKSFHRTAILQPGQSETITWDLHGMELFWFDVSKGWTAGGGNYIFSVGASSRDLRLHKTMEL